MGLPFLNLVARWGGLLIPSPGRFQPGRDPVPIVQEPWWASGLVWTGAENLAATGIRSPDHPTRIKSLNRRTCLRSDVPCTFHGSTAPVRLYLLFEVPRQHSKQTHHNPQDSSGRVIGPSQRPLPHNRQTSMLPVVFEPTISAGERPQIYALDRAATGTGDLSCQYFII